jgi:dethiobiotin synthetase
MLRGMIEKPARGLFVVGTDTGVGKTRVAAAIARQLAAPGVRVGVYKPAASGCPRVDGNLVSEDAVELWEAAGKPLSLEAVCPQRFSAPLAPHLAARSEKREIDARLLRSGLSAWVGHCDIVVVEGAGGFMSPLGDDEYVADLAADFGYPLIVVAPNRIGVVNQTLQTLIAAAVYRDGIEVAGVVLNHARPDDGSDPSIATNRAELERRTEPPVLAELDFNSTAFDQAVDWFGLAASAGNTS